jgi:hypothetical protein
MRIPIRHSTTFLAQQRGTFSAGQSSIAPTTRILTSTYLASIAANIPTEWISPELEEEADDDDFDFSDDGL